MEDLIRMATHEDAAMISELIVNMVPSSITAEGFYRSLGFETNITAPSERSSCKSNGDGSIEPTVEPLQQ